MLRLAAAHDAGLSVSTGAPTCIRFPGGRGPLVWICWELREVARITLRGASRWLAFDGWKSSL